jgi:hypothetical protein
VISQLARQVCQGCLTVLGSRFPAWVSERRFSDVTGVISPNAV